MHLNIYEIMDEFSKAGDKKGVLLKYAYRDDLKQLLQLNFHPEILFDIKEAPPYKIDVHMHVGMGYMNMFQALDKVYLFMAYNSRKPKGLTDEKQRQLLIQILESLEPKEAKLYMDAILKKVDVPGLTYELVSSTFPGILP